MKNPGSLQSLTVEEAARQWERGPIPAKPYYDPECWELEKQAVFMCTWLHIAHVCELPETGSFIRREVEFADASLLIVRGKDGEIRTFYNVCVHRGAQLVSEAAGKRAQFSCPYHKWTFGTDGNLLSAPDFKRFHVAKDRCSLKQLPTQVLGGMIFINFARNPKQSVREFFGRLADHIDSLPTVRAIDFTECCYEIGANWKTHYDNFLENYHLRFIHARTGTQTIGADNPFGYPTHYGFYGPHRTTTMWRHPSPPPPSPTQLLAYTRRRPAKEEGAYPDLNLKLYPGLHIVSMPSGTIFTHTHWPLDHRRTRSVVRIYCTQKPDSASAVFGQEFGAASILDVIAEDRASVESSQRGLASGALDEIMLQDHEILLRHQYEITQDKIAEYLCID